MEKDWNDISNWNWKADKFFEHIQKKFPERSPVTNIDLRDFKIDHVKLYCLLKSKVVPIPNGMYTMLLQDVPMSGLFWWDFVIDSELGFIHFYRSQSKIEVMTDVVDENFDLIEFIKYNFKKHSKDIDATRKGLETHTLYVNHYKSYKECVAELWKEVDKLQISPIDVENSISASNDLKVPLGEFISNNIKFHALGKSLLLNAAFLIEAYVNLIIRITAKEELKKYPDVLKKHLNSNFSDKLKNLKFHSYVLKEDIDLENQAVKDALEVIRYRNKYVHSDLSSKLNEIGEVYFDDMFPIFPHYEYSPIVQNIVQTYQVPTKEIVEFAYKASLRFIVYVEELFIDHKASDFVKMILEQNPIGFNQGSKNFSAIFSNLLVDARFGPENTDNK